MRSLIAAPAGFSFRRTVFSHGWYSLPPFAVDGRGERLESVVPLPDGGACAIVLRPRAGGVVLEADGKRDRAIAAHLRGAARRMLNLDLDLTSFYALSASQPHTAWIARAGAGRLLRGATAFEDLVKLVLTTNCTWALTQRMVTALVEQFGDRAPDGRRSFPTPAGMALAGERVLRERIRTGYRAPLLAELARRVAEGEVDPGSWESDAREPSELKREMLALPGVGPYVAENMLRLAGRPDGLALDSWLRAKYARIYHEGRRVTDRTIARRYARQGRWAGLTLWCEMTRDWFNGDEPSPALESLS